MVKDYGKVRFFLFANSYSANKIAVYLKTRYKGRKLEKLVKNLSIVLRIRQKQVNNFILLGVKPKCLYKKLPGSIKIYLEIEKELLKLSEEKLDEYSTALDDYQRQLLYPAFERAAGNSLTDVKNDQRFNNKLEEKIRKFNTIYYKVAYKYKLPTMRITPFIIRIIS